MSSVVVDEKKIEDILTRGVHEVFTANDLKRKLLSGKQLHLKLGTDVTGGHLHLGHAVIHRKIRDFQELGHKVTLIIGDFTTLVGDHSDKVGMREEATKENIERDEKTYKEQFFKTVYENLSDVKHNSEWLKDLNFNDVIRLAKSFTISQMLDRETFLLRYKNNKSIGLDEFLYPLMQGYDSVILNSDVELGGTDQTFNLLAGRKLMETCGLQPQNALVMKLLTGSDGRPMGKSLKNFIPIIDTAENMYGKIMSIVDDVIFEYFELVTRVPMAEINQMQEEMKKGGNPMKFKKRLAKEIVAFYHPQKQAELAQKVFEETVQQGKASDAFTTITNISGEMTLLEFLKKTVGENSSTSDIRRNLEQGGVEVNGAKITDINKTINFTAGILVKYGKREFVKIV